jgi:hypothetical protein
MKLSSSSSSPMTIAWPIRIIVPLQFRGSLPQPGPAGKAGIATGPGFGHESDVS